MGRVNWALRFYTEVLKLRHLHYGLWDAGAAYLGERHPWVSRVLWGLLGKRIRKLEESLPLLDSAAFARCKSYLVLLFQRAV